MEKGKKDTNGLELEIGDKVVFIYTPHFVEGVVKKVAAKKSTIEFVDRSTGLMERKSIKNTWLIKVSAQAFMC